MTDTPKPSEQERPSPKRVAAWFAGAASIVLALGLLGPGLASLDPEEEPAATSPPGPAAPAPQSSPVEWEAWNAGGPPRVAALEPGAESSATAPGPPGEPPPPGWDPDREVPARALDCIIEPSRMIDIRSPVRGRITKIHLERSEFAEQGQVLVELDASVEQAQVDIARMRAEMSGEIGSRSARMELGEARRRRAADLYQGDALSVDRRQEAETEAEVARLELEQARENRETANLELRRAIAVLERRTIRSPISGYVVENLLAAGEVVDEETILRLAQIDPLRVEVILPSTHYGAIRPGMRGEVTPDGPGGGVHEASVTVVDRIIDPASSTFGVRLELPNPAHTIPGGLRCQVRFLAEDS